MIAPLPKDPQPYGPNTRIVRRFLQRFAALGERQWREAADLFAAIEATRAFTNADLALASAIEHASLNDARDAAVGPLLQIVRGGSGDEHPVAAAALGATLAIVAGDTLTVRDFDVLYSPFATLVPVESLGDV